MDYTTHIQLSINFSKKISTISLLRESTCLLPFEGLSSSTLF
jgi:hypothetical protein